MIKTNNKKILLFSIVSIVVLSFIILIFIIKTDDKINIEDIEDIDKYLIENSELPKERWSRKLDIQQDDKYSIITNNYDGYRINIPAAWRFRDNTSPATSFTAYKLKEGVQALNTPEDGLELNIITLENSKNLSLIDWLAHSKDAENYFFENSKFQKIEYPEKIAYKTSYQIPFEFAYWLELDLAPNYKTTYIENSIVVQYIFGNRDKIFIASCTVIDENYISLISECEEQIQTFTIL